MTDPFYPQFVIPKTMGECFTYEQQILWLLDQISKLQEPTLDDVVTESSANAVKSSGIYNALLEKQNKLTAGSNITIDQNTNTISATGGGSITLDEEMDPTSSNALMASGIYEYVEPIRTDIIPRDSGGGIRYLSTILAGSLLNLVPHVFLQSTKAISNLGFTNPGTSEPELHRCSMFLIASLNGITAGTTITSGSTFTILNASQLFGGAKWLYNAYGGYIVNVADPSDTNQVIVRPSGDGYRVTTNITIDNPANYVLYLTGDVMIINNAE